jgi:hypothetical protein
MPSAGHSLFIMKRFSQRLEATFVLATYFCFFANQDCRAQDTADWDWVDKYFYSVLEELLPLERYAEVSLRSHRDLYRDTLEYSFSFIRNQDGSLEVIVRMADSVSLYDQIMTAHRMNPAESIETIKKNLKVRQRQLNEKSCPLIRNLYAKYEGLTVPVLSAKDRAERAKGVVTITLHPMIYRFETSISGGRMKLLLTDDGHPFVRWANEVRQALETCAK